MGLNEFDISNKKKFKLIAPISFYQPNWNIIVYNNL